MFKRLGLSSILALSLVGSCTSSDDDGAAPDAANNSGPFIDATPMGAIADAAPRPDAFVIQLPDARPSALECAGDPIPDTIAAPPVVISGEIQEVGITGSITTLSQSAHVSAHQFADDALIAEGDFTGTFSINGPASPDPIDAYLKSTSNGLVDSYVFPPATITADIPNTPIIMVGPLVFSNLLPAIAAAAQDPGNGAMIVVSTDCNQSPMEGAVVSITPSAGTQHYGSANGFPGQMGDFPATQSTGVTYFLNLPPGTYTLNSQAPDGTNLRSVDVKIFADSNSTAVIAP